jgi:hypothetical protein
MSDERVEVTIHPDGRVELHVVGVEGMSCVEITEPLVKALGGEVLSQELTQEAYIEVSDENENRLWT